MSDHGEKIVRLAQEFLSERRSCDLSTRSDDNTEHREKGITLKAACLAALLAATGGSAITHISHEINRPMNRYEMVEIQALVFYAAQQLASSEDAIRDEIASNLALPRTTIDSVSDYRRVRDYLRERLLHASS